MAGSFTFERLEDGIGVLTLDLPDKKVNTLGMSVLGDLAEHLTEIEKRTDLRGLLFRSGKPGQFIAGADLNELGAASVAPEKAAAVLALGHKTFSRLAALPFPTVALIDGNCMGGGTELALSMDERICSDSKQTKIVLPETQIGLVPGWGGTQRLPRLVGLQAAISMICGAEPAPPAKAKALGLVWDAVPVEALLSEGRRLIEIMLTSDDWRSERERRSGGMGLSPGQMMFAFGVAEGAIKEKTKGQYPAPLGALKAIREGINLPLAEGLKVEQSTLRELVGGNVAANLIAIFFMQNRLGRDDLGVKPLDVRRVGVLGAGFMGAGIAAAHARSGIPTAMVDVDEPRVAAGLDRAREVVASRIKIGRASLEDMASMLSHLNTSTSNTLFADSDVVIEAVVEDEKVKTDTFKALAKVLKPSAILASNTSTISITRMAESAPDASKFVGLHFFSPVDRMELVEVVRGEKTSDETVATVVALAKKIRKTPIVVKDCAGFLVNRVLFPYMNEAQTLISEGVSMDAIDKAATSFGMPMGPVALLDMVGLDVAYHAGNVLAAAYPDRAAVHPMLGAMLKAGRLGQKSGAGFRKYSGKKGKAAADTASTAILAPFVSGEKTLSADEINDRLFLPMLLEASRALEEGIVRDPAELDMGLILGTGFPPFKGGLLRWADSIGAAGLVAKLEKYRHLGKRFEPTASLLEQARTGGAFHPRPSAKIAG